MARASRSPRRTRVLTPGANRLFQHEPDVRTPETLSPSTATVREPRRNLASGGYQGSGYHGEKRRHALFNLTAAAARPWTRATTGSTCKWGPLALRNPVTGRDACHYAWQAFRRVNNAATATGAPNTDFFGNTRPQGGGFDIRRVELRLLPHPVRSVTAAGGLRNVAIGTTSASRQLVLHNTGNADLTGTPLAFSSPRYSRPAAAAGAPAPVH